MFAHFTHAIVRPPASNFADGLTTVDLGRPDIDLALAQHTQYCDALARHGCDVIALPANDRFPDSTFVEDTAFILPGLDAILTRPGADSRKGEVALIRSAITGIFPHTSQVDAPGTLDAGDVCETETDVFIGMSARTNEAGAQQLSAWLSLHGRRSTLIDIRETPGILHLKSGVTALGDGRLLATNSLVSHEAFRDYDIVCVPEGEEYAANCVRVNDVVFLAHGYPHTRAMLRGLGYTLELLDMSEFERMDGGLSCLSLRC